MSLLFESIKIENRKAVNLSFHNERFNKARRELLNIPDEIDLGNVISIPENITNSIHKCRVFYDYEVHKIEFVEYERKNIKKLCAVEANNISYEYKFSDRSIIDQLKSKYTSSTEEDILIIKNGLITETSFANVVLSDGTTWFTPAKPLLSGTQRAKLLHEKKIFEQNIAPGDLCLYKKIKLINALVEFDEAQVLPIESILL